MQLNIERLPVIDPKNSHFLLIIYFCLQFSLKLLSQFNALEMFADLARHVSLIQPKKKCFRGKNPINLLCDFYKFYLVPNVYVCLKYCK